MSLWKKRERGKISWLVFCHVPLSLLTSSVWSGINSPSVLPRPCLLSRVQQVERSPQNWNERSPKNWNFLHKHCWWCWWQIWSPFTMFTLWGPTGWAFSTKLKFSPQVLLVMLVTNITTMFTLWGSSWTSTGWAISTSSCCQGCKPNISPSCEAQTWCLDIRSPAPQT